MGGGDLFDMLMPLYRLARSQSCKWYCRNFFWVLSVAVIYGWLLYCHHTQLKRVLVQDLLDFTANISEILISEYKLDPILVREYHGRRHGQVMWKTHLPRELNLLVIQN